MIVIDREHLVRLDSTRLLQTYKGREFLLSIDAGADGPVFTVNAPIARLQQGQGLSQGSAPKSETVEWKAFQVTAACDSTSVGCNVMLTPLPFFFFLFRQSRNPSDAFFDALVATAPSTKRRGIQGRSLFGLLNPIVQRRMASAEEEEEEEEETVEVSVRDSKANRNHMRACVCVCILKLYDGRRCSPAAAAFASPVSPRPRPSPQQHQHQHQNQQKQQQKKRQQRQSAEFCVPSTRSAAG